MKYVFYVALLLVVVSLTLVSPAAAQPEPTNATGNATLSPTPSPADECSEDEYIDPRTTLCAVEYNDGTISITLLSEGDQRITLTDAAGALERGPINRRSALVPDDELTTLRMDVTEVNGRAGVTVDTGRTLYGVPVRDDTVLVGGPWTASDVQLGAAVAAISTTIAVLFLVWRKLSGKSDEPRRIA